jgi:hypothetical protein
LGEAAAVLVLVAGCQHDATLDQRAASTENRLDRLEELAVRQAVREADGLQIPPTPAPLPTVHLFRGSQDAVAYTTDRAGTNLPAQYRPWRYLQGIARNDPRLASGRDREAMLEVDEKGYSISFMHVTVQPVP